MKNEYVVIRTGCITPALKLAGEKVNADRIIDLSDEASSNGCDLIVFPALCITGHTNADLFKQKLFYTLALMQLDRICEFTFLLESNTYARRDTASGLCGLLGYFSASAPVKPQANLLHFTYMNVKYAVIGTNAAGFYALQALKERDPYASIAAVNGESVFPYKRTRVNKNFFPDTLDINNFLLSPPEWYKENGITLFNKCSAEKIDSREHTVHLDNGRSIHWEKLLLAVGAAPYKPEGEAFSSAHVLRTYEDALRIRKLIRKPGRCLIYGFGILAVETACQLKEAGMDVTLAGRDADILLRYFSAPFREIITQTLHNHAIKLYRGITAEGITYSDDHFSFNHEGVTHTYDCMIYALGITPRVHLAQSAGIYTDGGIVVNNNMETSIPGIFAAGDCCRFKGKSISGLWHSAQHQGQCAAANMVGSKEPYTHRLHRLKSEIFETYCFTMRPFQKNEAQDMEKESFSKSPSLQLLFYFQKGNLQGVEMIGDKQNAKLYEKAVREHWEREKVHSAFLS